MAEAANDLAYDTYITIEEAGNVSSENPDPDKIKSLVSKLQNKLNSIIGQGTRINSALEKMGNAIDVNKTIIDKIKKGNKNNITSQEKSIFKRLQQNIITIAKDAAKTIKEYLSTIDWTDVALFGAVGAISGVKARKTDMDITWNNREANYKEMKFMQACKNAGRASGNDTDQYIRNRHDKLVHADTKLNNMKVHPIKSTAKWVGSFAAAGAGLDVAAQLYYNKKMKKLKKESGIESLISSIIATILKYANMLKVKLDKSVTAMFDKFKKSK